MKIKIYEKNLRYGKESTLLNTVYKGKDRKGKLSRSNSEVWHMESRGAEIARVKEIAEDDILIKINDHEIRLTCAELCYLSDLLFCYVSLDNDMHGPQLYKHKKRKLNVEEMK